VSLLSVARTLGAPWCPTIATAPAGG